MDNVVFKFGHNLVSHKYMSEGGGSESLGMGANRDSSPGLLVG